MRLLSERDSDPRVHLRTIIRFYVGAGSELMAADQRLGWGRELPARLACAAAGLLISQALVCTPVCQETARDSIHPAQVGRRALCCVHWPWRSRLLSSLLTRIGENIGLLWGEYIW